MKGIVATVTISEKRMRLRGLLGVLLVAVVGNLLYPVETAAWQQRESLPLDLPNGPAKQGFELKRFSNFGNGWFETFYVDRTEALRAVLNEERLAGDTRLLVLETAAGRLALVIDQMSFHHIAEGSAGGKDWMATF